MHSLPWWKVCGKLTPLAAGFHNVEQSVHHLPQFMLTRTAAAVTMTALCTQQWLQSSPLAIAQITPIHDPTVEISRPCAYNSLYSSSSLWTDSKSPSLNFSAGCVWFGVVWVGVVRVMLSDDDQRKRGDTVRV